MKKKILIAVSAVAAVCVIAGAFWLLRGRDKGKNTDELVYVEKVSELMGLGSGMGNPGRFSGVVESQETWEIQQKQDKTIKEILVEVGEDVDVGTPLLTYDTATMETDLKQAELELERFDNDITNLNNQIKQLEKEKKEASDDEKLSYTTQIQTAQTDIKKTEYEKKSKSVEIEQMKEQIANATITSEIKGVVKSINNGESQDMTGGESQALMTILSTGDFRIKGKVNEQNLSAVTEGEPAIVRSRVDDKRIWNGTFGKIDVDNPAASNNSGMYGMGMSSEGGSDQSASTSYYFYVELESSDGLLLGQHVYIEQNAGQEEQKEGVWLDASFIADLDSKPYVWADNGKEKLEKRSVVLGQFDEALNQYEIKDGLSREDAVAFPLETLKEGAPTTDSPTALMNEGDMSAPAEGDMPVDEAMPSDEGMSSEEPIPSDDMIESPEGEEGAVAQ